ncbi:hypothetical protein DID88_002962 [Monilinia fructigena]|uniref:Uncharacterized protein n=1 Tax=Monilinia fructigena TaxID=38457 RepID=A0A395IU71_9HELO|nr:hypothetical protein DID88_002962 [Monilinia fructigena]
MMDDVIYNKNDDTNIAMVINATLIDTYNGEDITVHAGQTWAYKFHIPHWPKGEDILLGRGEAELQSRQDWTRTAFEVDDAVELCSAARVEDRAPEFRLSGLVLKIKDEWLSLGWERYDDDLGNFAWIYVKVKCPIATKDMLYKQYYVEGIMSGYDRMKDWVANTITVAP